MDVQALRDDVLTAYPATWLNVPPPFLQRRWSRTRHLPRRAGSMEHSGSGEQGLYRFDANETGYTISTDEGDNRGHGEGGGRSRAEVFL